MGLLADGHALAWNDAKKVVEYVSRHGLSQFLFVYNRVKTRERDCLFWGDEIEYLLVKFDDAGKRVVLKLNGHEVLRELEASVASASPGKPVTKFLPEYGAFMIEATPGQPYHGDNSSFRFVEPNMRLRRQLIESKLGPDCAVMTMTAFPLMGVGEFTDPPAPPGGPIAQSLFVSDSVINPHPRFGALTRNIRERRGEKVCILIPLYRDQHTDPRAGAVPGRDDLPDYHIYMDAMAFGMGCCCLQVTFQCPNIAAARYLYDQFAVLAPIMLALTAATPVLRGLLSDYDVRWRVISASVDDRTPEERGLRAGGRVLRKSRYDSVSTYISDSRALHPSLNDVPLETDETALRLLLEAGVDEVLARHVAHLWVRDPLVIYNESIYVDDATHTNHFENIQSTNWQTVRFKPPPPDTPMGWRVEFRSMEVQMTDFENAAFTVFVALLTRAIVAQQLNLYIPMSKNEANMETAHQRDAVRTGKFYWRRSIVSLLSVEDVGSLEDTVDLLSINEIINGTSGSGEDGLIGLVRRYVASQPGFDARTQSAIAAYLDFIGQRAAGQLLTPAQWIRRQVVEHPAYRRDSVVGQEVAYDLMRAVRDVAAGVRPAPELLGTFGAPAASYEGGEVKFGGGGCGDPSGREFKLRS